MSRPVAVLISDIHYSLKTLDLAHCALRTAVSKANDLRVPLIIAGDLHDTKANIRGECLNAMRYALNQLTENCFILRGNHDSINEKSTESSITCLDGICHPYDGDSAYTVMVLNHPTFTNEIAVNGMSLQFIPYYHDADELRKYLKTIDKHSTIIMHQGITNAKSGEYIQDKSAINPEDVVDFRVISGHYHTRQTISIPGGYWDYIGNPYTLNYGESNDPPKGYQVLYSDGSLQFIRLNLPKHVVYQLTVAELESSPNISNLEQYDLLWVKLTGTREELLKYNKTKVSSLLFKINPIDFRLDLIPNEATCELAFTKLTKDLLLDNIIESMDDTSKERKTHLKSLWRQLCE